jgi:hypothetical protein
MAPEPWPWGSVLLPSRNPLRGAALQRRYSIESRLILKPRIGCQGDDATQVEFTRSTLSSRIGWHSRPARVGFHPRSPALGPVGHT